MQKKDAERGFLSRLFSSGDPKVKAEQVPRAGEAGAGNEHGARTEQAEAPRARAPPAHLGLLHEQLK